MDVKDKATYSIELEKSMHGFLEEMVEKHSLTDVDKAIRCLVNYAREETAAQDSIFGDIRCLDC